jgi:hypothetical protein
MRKVSMGARKSVGAAGSQVAREQLRSIDQKFRPGPTPLEREPFEKTIKPQYKDQLEQMMKLMTKYAEGADTSVQNAVALWKAQVQQGTFSDQVKFDFARRFYYWLLGRGTDEDHGRTMWGRGNAAVYNKEVRSYIESFSQKRLQYAQQLALLASVVPTTLNAYYLYFKYIVGGNLKRVKTDDGKTDFWDMSDEDYLADFEMFKMEFDDKTQWLGKPYSDGSKPQNGHIGEAPYPEMKDPREIKDYSVLGLSRRPGQGGDARATEIVESAILTEQSFRANQKPNGQETINERKFDEAISMQDKAGMAAVLGGFNLERAVTGDSQREQEDFGTPIPKSRRGVSFADNTPSATAASPRYGNISQNDNNPVESDSSVVERAWDAYKKDALAELAQLSKSPVELDEQPESSYDEPIGLRKRQDDAQKLMAAVKKLPASEERKKLESDVLRHQVQISGELIFSMAKSKTRQDINRAQKLAALAAEHDLESSGVDVSSVAPAPVQAELIGKSVSGSSESSDSAQLGTSVNSAELSEEVGKQVRAELLRAGDIDIAPSMFGKASTEESGEVSRLIDNNPVESPTTKSSSEADPGSLTQESSYSFSVEEDPPEHWDDWEKLSQKDKKIVMTKDRVYKRLDTATEKAQMTEFYDMYGKTQPAIIPKRVRVDRHIANAKYGVFATERLKGYQTLAEFMDGNKPNSLNQAQKKALREGLEKAYAPVKHQWNDLYNPHNIAVKIERDGSNNFANVDVKFFEGGKNEGPMAGVLETRLVQHLVSFYRQQWYRRYLDKGGAGIDPQLI